MSVWIGFNVHILRDTNFIFVVSPPYVFVTGQPQKKGVSPDSEKIQIKPVKDASFVDLSPSAKSWAALGSKEFKSKLFDTEGGTQPIIEGQTSSH